MPWLVRVAAPGLAEEPERFALAVTLARVMLPCLVAGGPSLVLCAVLNGAGRFAAGTSMAMLFNLSALAGLFALEPVQLAVLVPACRRAGLGSRISTMRRG